MYFEKYLIKQIRTFRLQSKSIGKLFYVPFLFNYVLIPVCAYINYTKYALENEMVYESILTFSQYFTPIMAAWWILFIFSEPIEGEGNELFFVDNRSKTGDFVRLTFVYLVSVLIPFLFYTYLFPNMMLEFVRIAIGSVFFASFAYFFLFLTGSVTATMIPAVIYCFFSIFGVRSGSIYFTYYDARFITMSILYERYLPIFIVSMIFLALGIQCNHMYKKYR